MCALVLVLLLLMLFVYQTFLRSIMLLGGIYIQCSSGSSRGANDDDFPAILITIIKLRSRVAHFAPSSSDGSEEVNFADKLG
jgi:hypothetical protein